MLMESAGERVLESVFSSFIDVITGNIKDIIVDRKLEEAFYKCGEMISVFENSGKDGFGDAVQKVFSRDVLQEIYDEMKRGSGYDLTAFVRGRLKSVCKDYDIEADGLIGSFVDIFKQCIFHYDQELYNRIYQGEWREEQRGILARIENKVDQIYSGVENNETEKPSVLLIETSNNPDRQDALGLDDSFFKWELKYPSGRGIYLTEEEKKNRALALMSQWGDERKSAPSWYIVPPEKRRSLRTCTVDEDLLYFEEILSPEERFDFCYELVWRYEKGFIPYTGRMRDEIHKIWDNAQDQEWLHEERKVHWFNMGYALLRDYREDLDAEKWSYVYNRLWKQRNLTCNGEAELQIEKIHLLFMQIQLEETRSSLLAFQCDTSAFGIRLQHAGLMAEFGLREEAWSEFELLEQDLLKEIAQDTNRNNHVLYGSLLGCVYFMQGYLLQAWNPFKRDGKLQEVWDKSSAFKRYFDFQKEKDNFEYELYNRLKKEKRAVPFELNIETRVLIRSGSKKSEIYDFFRLLSRMAVPLHIGMTKLLDDEPDFIRGLVEQYMYIGWHMLLRLETTKTTEMVLGRKQCLALVLDHPDHSQKVFEYVYRAVNENLKSIQICDRRHGGNAYTHVLSNGLEILKRLGSVAGFSAQKKLLLLACRLIESGIVKEYRVLNRWLRHIMNITDEQVKASVLNELLQCSAKIQECGQDELPPDLFAVFPVYSGAEHLYRKAVLDPDTIDCILEKAAENTEKKKYYVSRLGRLADWDILTPEQREQFAVLLWSDIPEEQTLPFGNKYYPGVFLRWPYPGGVNPEEKIKHVLLNPKSMDEIKAQQLTSLGFGECNYFYKIQHLNYSEPGFWKPEEIEKLLTGLTECWHVLKKQYSEAEHPEFYEEDFLSRAKAIYRTIISFARKQIIKISSDILCDLRSVEQQMEEHGLETLELSVLLAAEEELPGLAREIIVGMRSNDEDKANAAVDGGVRILLDHHSVPETEAVLKAIVELCLYRKEPGLLHTLSKVDQVMSKMPDIDLTQDIMLMLYETLDNIDKYTAGIHIFEKSEQEIKYRIRIRTACAQLAYQLWKNEEKNGTVHSSAVLNWREICKGKRSRTEFAEVRRCWGDR